MYCFQSPPCNSTRNDGGFSVSAIKIIFFGIVLGREKILGPTVEAAGCKACGNTRGLRMTATSIFKTLQP